MPQYYRPNSCIVWDGPSGKMASAGHPHLQSLVIRWICKGSYDLSSTLVPSCIGFYATRTLSLVL